MASACCSTINDRNENGNEPVEVPSRLLKEFIKDQDERPVYEECCRQLNTAKHPHREEHFYILSRAFGIDSDVAKELMKDQRGSAQALFEYLDVTRKEINGKEITLEQFARELDRLPGRDAVAKMLREADDRLQQKSCAQQQGNLDVRGSTYPDSTSKGW